MSEIKKHEPSPRTASVGKARVVIPHPGLNLATELPALSSNPDFDGDWFHIIETV